MLSYCDMKTERFLLLFGKLLLYALPLSLLWVFDLWLYPYVSSKHLVFRALVLPAFAFSVSLILLNPKHLYKFKNKLSLTVLAFLIAFLISDLLAPDLSLAFWGYAERMGGFVNLFYLSALFFSAVILFQRQSNWLWFFRIFNLVSMYVVIKAMLDYMTHHPSRLDTIFGNPIYLAVFMIFAIGFALLSSTLSKQTAEQGIYLATLPFYMMILWLTGTRGAILALFAGAIVAALAYGFFTGAKGKKMLYYFAPFFLGLVIIVGIIFAPAEVMKGSATLSRIHNISLTSGTLHSRLLVWSMVPGIVSERPLSGWGHEGFNYAFSKYYNPQLWNQETWFDRVHSQPLDTLVQGGVFVFLIYLAIWFFIFRYIFIAEESASKKAALLFIAVSYLVFSLSVFDNLSSTLPFYAFLAYLVFVHHQNKSNNALQEELPRPVHFQAVAVVFALTIIFTGGQQILQHYKAARALVEASLLTATLNYADRLHAHKAANKLADEILANLQEASADKIFSNKELISVASSDRISSSIVNAKEVDGAVKAAYIKLMRSWSDKFRNSGTYKRYRILDIMARWYNGIGQEKIAYKILKQLIASAPRKVQLRELLADMYMDHGKYPQALTEIKKVLSINPQNKRAQKALVKIRQAMQSGAQDVLKDR